MKKQISVTIDKELLEFISELSRKEVSSVSTLLNGLLSDYMEKRLGIDREDKSDG